MKPSPIVAVAMLIALLAELVMSCNYSEKPETDQDRSQRNTGVTNSSAATAGLLKPADVGDNWYDGNVDQFPGPQDYKGLTDCGPVQAYQVAVQTGLSAESQITMEKLAGNSKPAVGEELRVFKDPQTAAKAVQAQQALFSGGQWKACILNRHDVDSANDPNKLDYANFAEGTPLGLLPPGGASWHMEEDYAFQGQPHTLLYERYVWASGKLLITLDLTFDKALLDKSLVDTVLLKASTNAEGLNKK